MKISSVILCAGLMAVAAAEASNTVEVGTPGAYVQQLLVEASVGQGAHLLILSAKNFNDPNHSKASITVFERSGDGFGRRWVNSLPNGRFWPQQMVLHDGEVYLSLMYGALEPGEYLDADQPIVVRYRLDDLKAGDPEQLKELPIDDTTTVAVQEASMAAHSAYGLYMHGKTLLFTLCSQDTTMQGGVCYGPSRLGVWDSVTDQQKEIRLPGDYQNPVAIHAFGRSAAGEARLGILSTAGDISRLTFLLERDGQWQAERQADELREYSFAGYAGKLALVYKQGAVQSAFACLSMANHLQRLDWRGDEVPTAVPFSAGRGDCGDVALQGEQLAVADNQVGEMILGNIHDQDLLEAKRHQITKQGRLMDIEPFNGGWLVLWQDAKANQGKLTWIGD